MILIIADFRKNLRTSILKVLGKAKEEPENLGLSLLNGLFIRYLKMLLEKSVCRFFYLTLHYD